MEREIEKEKKVMDTIVEMKKERKKLKDNGGRKIILTSRRSKDYEVAK